MSDDQKKLYDRIASIDPINRQEMNTCDDISAGLLYATTFRDSLRFNETANKWYVYDGKRWTADPNRTAEVYAENLARALWAYSNNISSKDFLSWVYRLQNTRGRKAMMEDARKHLSAQTTDFDKGHIVVIVRKCSVCHERFETSDKKKIYCSDYCRMAANEPWKGGVKHERTGRRQRRAGALFRSRDRNGPS